MNRMTEQPILHIRQEMSGEDYRTIWSLLVGERG